MEDAENIGWAGCVYLDPHKERILLVQSKILKDQIESVLKERGWPREKYWMDLVVGEMTKAGTLPKKGRWELAGSGKIAWWEGNGELQKEFQALSPEAPAKFSRKSKYNINTPEQIEFLKTISERVLQDPKLLLNAAGATADDEFLQEAGPIILEKELVHAFVAKNRDNGKDYPKFIYLVTKTEGELRKEPDKGTISKPEWVELSMLHSVFDKSIGSDEQFLIHKSHLAYIITVLKYLIERGETKLAKILNLLEKRLAENPRRYNNRNRFREEPPLPRETKKGKNADVEEKPTFQAGSWEEVQKIVKPMDR